MGCLLASIFLRFCSVLEPNLAPKTRQEPTKIASKSSVNFNMVSGPFWTRLGATNPPKINLSWQMNGKRAICFEFPAVGLFLCASVFPCVCMSVCLCLSAPSRCSSIAPLTSLAALARSLRSPSEYETSRGQVNRFLIQKNFQNP